MEVTRSALLSLLLVYSISNHAWAEIEYIAPEQQDRLQTQFEGAAFNPESDTAKISGQSWSCDMFGARSHMQAQHGLKLYRMNENAGAWRNEGAQLVTVYKYENGALTGRKERFEDQVKITKDGLLVSRLSLNNPAKTVVAYSVCKTL